MTLARLIEQRDLLLEQARAKIPNLRISSTFASSGNESADIQALQVEIAELEAFIDYRGPDLYIDAVDEEEEEEEGDDF